MGRPLRAAPTLSASLTSPRCALRNLNKVPSDLTRFEMHIREGEIIMRRFIYSENQHKQPHYTLTSNGWTPTHTATLSRNRLLGSKIKQDAESSHFYSRGTERLSRAGVFTLPGTCLHDSRSPPGTLHFSSVRLDPENQRFQR